ncbi:right-handed parallel beta-helix repeat-containing protein [Streptomyces pathocidini]|uniref:Right-handed parallel beta-helix repeat-containing protein n=1 Tax=Streptomyces pathocidini TaxID=1650571 RepID=A0ABW7UV17_9ACTN|nr:right-handed parallel beta-helix repeat-containing protein [Streptomyces pathocidini]
MFRSTRRLSTPQSRITLLAMSALLLTGGATFPADSATAAAECTPKEFFVAPDGSDRNKGTKDSAWRTIEHARDHIRDKGLNRSMRCDVVVNLRAGDYPVAKTVDFDDRDSGSGDHDVVYRSYDGPGKARLQGAKPVTGWKEYKDGIYEAKVDKPVYTLFEDGQRATVARYPNRKTETEWGPYLISTIPEPEKEAVRRWLWTEPGVLKPEWDLDHDDASVFVWSGGSWNWFNDVVPIRDVDEAKDQISLKYQTRYAMMNSRSGSRFFLQNSLDFLDQPGEWYMDDEANTVYYKPRGDIKDVKVLAPTVKTILNVAGASADRRVENLTFDGLAFQYSDFVDWYRFGWVDDGDSGYPHKYPEYDRQIEMPRNRFGAITVTNSRDITLKGTHISDTGYHAVYALFANEGLTVRDSLLENIGGDGIKVEGGYPGEGDISHGHLFTNNYFYHYGELLPGDAAGVELMNTSRNEVSYSHFKHSARYGVSLEVRPEVKIEDNYARGNTFKYLRMDEMGLDSSEVGAFYTYGTSNFEPHKIDNHAEQILIGDVINDPSVPDRDSTRGVHMDNGGCSFSFKNIEVGEVLDDKYQGPQDPSPEEPCNTIENANWKDGFDTSKMEYDKIGVLDSFPYAVPGGERR